MSCNKHPLEILSLRYPQLRLPIEDGIHETELYKNSVLRGVDPGDEYSLQFSLSDEDTLELQETPAGKAEILYLKDRQDFEHCVRALAYRCDNREIPPSMGAIAISGLINWEKIRNDDENFKDSIIILSGGEYSAVPADKIGLTPEEWLEKSVTIRKYHELAHFVSRRLYKENKSTIRDEVLADMTGLISAFGEYDTFKAKLFLGTEGKEYRKGGRLENYESAESMPELMKKTNKMIDNFALMIDNISGTDAFNALTYMEINKINL